MSFGYVLFLMAAMCTAAFVLLNYIQLQAELTQRTKNVASKEVQLNNLKIANDEEYNRIMSSIDLEEIKRVAIGELGMVYAQEGQIVTYTNEKNDYMRQVGQEGEKPIYNTDAEKAGSTVYFCTAGFCRIKRQTFLACKREGKPVSEAGTVPAGI